MWAMDVGHGLCRVGRRGMVGVDHGCGGMIENHGRGLC